MPFAGRLRRSLTIEIPIEVANSNRRDTRPRPFFARAVRTGAVGPGAFLGWHADSPPVRKVSEASGRFRGCSPSDERNYDLMGSWDAFTFLKCPIVANQRLEAGKVGHCPITLLILIKRSGDSPLKRASSEFANLCKVLQGSNALQSSPRLAGNCS
jgi:hypothetical protein